MYYRNCNCSFVSIPVNMAPIPLDCVARVFYAIFFTKFFVAKFFPQIAQQYTDFCHSCKVDSLNVAAACETWGYFLTGLLYLGVAEFGNEKAQRKVLQYGMIMPVAKLGVLGYLGESVMGASEGFYVAIAENVIIFLLSVLSCYVWFKDVGIPAAATANWTFKDNKTAIRILYLELTAWCAYTCYCLFEHNTAALPFSDSGVFGAAMTAASMGGGAICLMGVAQCPEPCQTKIVQYFGLCYKGVCLGFLLPLGLPWILAHEHGLHLAYWVILQTVVHMVHLCACTYKSDTAKQIFWGGGFTCIFLGVLGLVYPSATATQIYRVPELGSAGEPVFRLIGLFLALVGASLYGFASVNNTDAFEQHFVYMYGVISVWGTVNEMYLGLFSDMANMFLLLCVYRLYFGFVANKYPFLKFMAPAVGVSGGAGGGSKSRSKTPKK